MISGSFFKKLKKGMGAEMPQKLDEETKEEKVKEKKETKSKPSSTQKKAPLKVKKIEMKATLIEEQKTKEVKEEKPKAEKWFEPEGQLAVDIYQTEGELIIQSAIAGVKPEDLDIAIEQDVITIRGKRGKPFEEQGDYFTQECYWGPFSREIILPVEVNPHQIEASMKEGILTIRMPKILRERKTKVVVKKMP